MSREEVNKQVTKQKLVESMKKRIQTTMIGALASIEEHFGNLWGHDTEGALTQKQENMKELYNELRSEILDKGNVQIRNMETEINGYEVSSIRYQYNLPIRKEQ